MTQPNPQQQKSPEQRESQTPLQILPAMLHAVFCQTADVFNAPQRQQPRAVIYTNAQIRTSVSACNERFQYALDLLEMDILKAKATLRRDLSHLRALAAAEAAARLALEEAAAAAQERARLEAETQRRKTEEAAKAEEERQKREAEEKEAELQRRQDAVMQDAPVGGEKLVSPDSAGSGGFDYLFGDPTSAVSGGARRPPDAPAPAAPMPNADAVAPGNFDDFLANFSIGAGGHGAGDGGMGGGQPLEDADQFDSGFFFYGA